MGKLKQRVYDVVSYKKNLRMLQTRIQILKDKVDRENNSRTEIEQQWVEKAYEDLKMANDNLEGRNTIIGKKCLFSGCWGPTSSSETSKLLRVITETLQEGVGLSSNFFGLFYCKNLKSRENMLHDILEASMNTCINMIGIYGMIGVGKTILVTEMERRAQNNKLFDVVVMVPIFDSLQVKLIQTQIANKIGLQLLEDDDEETRAQLLKNMLDEKVIESEQEHTERAKQQRDILIIFDGILHATDLEKVGIPYGRKGQSRCTVVLVSRNMDVCKKMGAQKTFLVECLDLEEAQILYRQRLGNKIRSIDITLESEMYQRIENAILMKCGGLPSMINSLAYALWSRSQSDWEIIAYHIETHTLLEVDEILKGVPHTTPGTHSSGRSKLLPESHRAHAILELCNNFIQKGEKQKLFLLCCVIQQGADLSLEKIMRYGIGFGLFGVDSSPYAVEEINSWVDELKLSSLLMESKITQHVKMHDIVRDVAISALSQGDYRLPIIVEACAGWETRESFENCVAISMTPDSNFNCLNGLELPKLEAFLLKGTTVKASSSLPDTFFQGMNNLKILDISKIRHLPSSIGDLKNLVTLHLEDCYISDDGVIFMICNLARLEVLSLRGSRFGTLPDEIGKLTNLRVLDLTGCRLDTFPVDGVAKLGRLRELYLLFGSIQPKWSTDDMKKLSPLPLEGFEIKIKNTNQMSPDSIKFPNLRRFRILYIDSDRSRYGPLDEGVISYSRALSINSENGRHQFNGLKDLLSRAEYLHIKGANDLEQGIADFNINGGFSHLKELYVKQCDATECLLDARNLSIIQQREMFPELQVLTLDRLPNLTSICRPQPCYGFFPKLRELRLNGLSELRHVLPLQFAVRLRVMQVSDCGSLLHIFSTSKIDKIQHGADESTVELPFMEKLEVKGLAKMASLLALQDSPAASTTREEFQITRYLLFNEKIKLPSLKELHLERLDQIWNVWDFLGEACRKSPCFGNLKEITISSCNKLESVFSYWIANSLLHLEKLEVERCDNMKEVITSIDYTEVEEDTNPTITINFPKLQTLRLKWLSSLQCFGRGRLLLKFPKLRKLHLFSLKKMKTFTLSNTQSLQKQGMATALFDGVIDFGSLDNLSISHMEIESLQRDGETILFPNLSELSLDGLPNMQALPIINSRNLRILNLREVEFAIQPVAYKSAMPIKMSWELEELILSRVDSFWKELFADYENGIDDGQQLDVKLLFSFRKLKLSFMFCQLKTIPWNRLKNLRSLNFYDVKVGGNSMMSTTLLVGGGVLPLLEDIKIQACNDLEAIVSGEVEEDWEFVKYGITLFPCLRSIYFYRLPNLKSFSMGKYEAHFPSLETIEIFECDIMQSFSLGRIRTPRLRHVKLISSYSGDRIADINELFRSVNTVEAEASRAAKAPEAESRRAAKAPETEARKEREARIRAAEKKGEAREAKAMTPAGKEREARKAEERRAAAEKREAREGEERRAAAEKKEAREAEERRASAKEREAREAEAARKQEAIEAALSSAPKLYPRN